MFPLSFDHALNYSRLVAPVKQGDGLFFTTGHFGKAPAQEGDHKGSHLHAPSIEKIGRSVKIESAGAV